MIRKACITGVLVAGMALTAVQGSPVYRRVASSARDFQQYFQALKSADDSVGPLQRFVFSLVLANAKNTPRQPATPQHRS
jgi:hypothetical protein